LAALSRAGLSERRRQGHEITIWWFLGWCRRQRPELESGREAARRFYLAQVRERNPAEWPQSGWGAALRWYLEWRENTVDRRASGCHFSRQETGGDRSVLPAGRAEVGKVVGRPREDSWEVRLVRQIRLRHLSYRTEQAYLVSRLHAIRTGQSRDTKSSVHGSDNLVTTCRHSPES